MRYLVFIGSYVNAPAGDERPAALYFLRDVIEQIGRKYGTIKGSDFAKGKHYMKHKINGCRGRHVKLMLHAVNNVRVKNNTDVAYVWRFQKDTYAEIFNLVVSFIEENNALMHDNIEKELQVVKTKKRIVEGMYSELLIREPLIGLDEVIDNGNSDIKKNEAIKLKSNIVRYDKSIM